MQHLVALVMSSLIHKHAEKFKMENCISMKKYEVDVRKCFSNVKMSMNVVVNIERAKQSKLSCI